MKKPSKNASPSKADLRRKVGELNAMLASTYHFADATLSRAGDGLMGRAVILRLTTLGGTEVIPPVAVLDGLSSETIDAIRRDLERSWTRATELRPRGCS